MQVTYETVLVDYAEVANDVRTVTFDIGDLTAPITLKVQMTAFDSGQNETNPGSAESAEIMIFPTLTPPADVIIIHVGDGT